MAVFALFTPIGLIENGVNGQPIGLILLLVIGAAYALNRNRVVLASLLAVCSLAEPHLALPVLIVLFVWEPRTRPWLALFVILVVAASVLVVPAKLTFEYATSVISGQASAETGWYQQYSLTYFLTYFGAGRNVALFAGLLSYIVALVLATWLSPRIAALTNSRAALILIPAALSIIGGPYIHVFQIILALPATLLLADSQNKTISTMARIASFLVAVPWMKAWIYGMIVLTTLLGATVFQATTAQKRIVGIALALSVLFPVLYFGVRPVATIPPVRVSFSREDLLQKPYTQYVLLASPSERVRNAMFIAKWPTWIGLILITYACVLQVMRRSNSLAAIETGCPGNQSI